MTDEQIKHMVNRFLGWKLPEHFNPDCGISFEPIHSKGTPHEGRREPSGTNLFDARQAESMVRYMLEGMPALAQPVAGFPPRDQRNWPEDAGHENGNYSNTCVQCGRAFTGHKRRITCKACVTSNALAQQPVAKPGEDVIAEIAAERQRQTQAEGWEPEHDDEHDEGELARAAACYAWAGAEPNEYFRERVTHALIDRFGSDDGAPIKRMWPFSFHWWKPKDRRRDLIRAAALIVAEIERLDRAAQRTATERSDDVG